ncbi:MAG: UDP-glucose/iron transport system permease protein [Actinomycetota bacterium]|jgi:putative ABC transport system permease protein|nr:UDP-glucose/iron transport system permease protein [Actinomycetota bacterium]
MTDASVIGVLLSLILVAVAFAVSMRFRLKLESDLAIATVRAIVQLSVVALVITFVFDHELLAIGVVLLMLGAASWTSARRLKGIPRGPQLATLAIASGAIVGLVVVFGTGVFDLEPRFVIPIAGMLIGNCMTAVSVAGVRVKEELTDKTLEVEARLALGVRARDALTPYIRRATTTALIPIIDTTKTVGLITLPGAFTGMLLGGATPAQAARVQLIVLFMLLGAVAIAGMTTTLLVTRMFVGPGERIVIPTER